MANSQGKRRRLVEAGVVRSGRLQNLEIGRRSRLLAALLLTSSALLLAAPGSALAAHGGKHGHAARESSSTKAGKAASSTARSRSSAREAREAREAKEARGSSAGGAKARRQAKAKAIAAPESRVAAARATARTITSSAAAKTPTLKEASGAEARLIAIYEMFGRGQARPALDKARELVRDYPNFQLAQLVYGDLLAAQVSPMHNLSDAASIARLRGNPVMAELHDESLRRLQALRERPPPGTVPSQFLALSLRSRYAIAVDASRSRLYLLENSDKGLQLVADYYVSVGKLGIGKVAEGDNRTPLGVYYITSNIDPKTLREIYGAGALPINYPNPYDTRRGKTGSGIWLHGTPPEQFARPPLASDGCVVMANPDLRQLLGKVQIGATPVVTARSLQWISQPQAQKEAQAFTTAIAAWEKARADGDEARLKNFYLPDFQRVSKKATEGISVLQDEIAYVHGRQMQIKDMSYLHWRDGDDTMVATFGEVFEGERSGRTRRQYWLRQGGEWKLFHEEILG